MRILKNLKGEATRIVIVVFSVFVLMILSGCGGGGTSVAAPTKEVILTGNLIPDPSAPANTQAIVGSLSFSEPTELAELGWQRREANPTQVRAELRFRSDVGVSDPNQLVLVAQLGTGRGGPEWTPSNMGAKLAGNAYQFIPDPQGRGGVSHWKVVRNGVVWRTIATENLFFDLSTELVREGVEAKAASSYADWMIRWCTAL